MYKKNLFKHWYIKICRYLFNQKFLTVMDGPLKGYLWTTGSNYDYLAGNYENPLILETFCLWLKPATIFYDLGGNVGFYALTANRFITTGKIFSFEPMPFNRAIFEKHIALNKKHILNDNIRILDFAISDREKETSFSNNVQQKEGNTYIKGSAVYSGAGDTISVKCFSIDELLQQGYDRPDIIKIDVEGAEYDVLKGAVNTLRQYKPYIILATHDCHLPGVEDKCVTFLQDLGYMLKDAGDYNKQVPGLGNYIAIHKGNL